MKFTEKQNKWCFGDWVLIANACTQGNLYNINTHSGTWSARRRHGDIRRRVRVRRRISLETKTVKWASYECVRPCAFVNIQSAAQRGNQCNTPTQCERFFDLAYSFILLLKANRTKWNWFVYMAKNYHWKWISFVECATTAHHRFSHCTCIALLRTRDHFSRAPGAACRSGVPNFQTIPRIVRNLIKMRWDHDNVLLSWIDRFWFFSLGIFAAAWRSNWHDVGQLRVLFGVLRQISIEWSSDQTLQRAAFELQFHLRCLSPLLPTISQLAFSSCDFRSHAKQCCAGGIELFIVTVGQYTGIDAE